MKKLYFFLIALSFFINTNAQIITIPDANFKAKLLAASPSNTIAKDLSGNYFKIDANSDNQIDVNEALNVKYLDVRSSSISNLSSLEYFTNLTTLICTTNPLTVLNVSSNTALVNLVCNSNALSNLDVTNNIALKVLDCSSNNITSLTLSNNSQLNRLNCSYNQLTSLNVGNNNALTVLYCFYNQITNLNLSNNLLLESFDCESNSLSSLNINNNTGLKYLTCGGNQLGSIDLSNNTALIGLDCSFNQLSNLDLSNNINLSNLICSGNQLTSLFVKNGSIETSLNFMDNPNLTYICADELQLMEIQNQINSNGYVNCVTNSYCSFTPGGTFYTIQGSNKYDGNNNGCDALDLGLPNLKFDITDGTNSGSLISNTTGSYSIPVQAGMHTLTPVLENPTYFTISPASSTVNFPTQTSPFTQNFCITANGVHPDLEITLLPITAARPGFDATYKIIYKNKGNTTQSGTVNLTFNDAVLDLVSTNPVVTNQTINNLSWNFTNLVPFETREVSVILNVNSPMETPAVNNGDILNYSTSISSVATDDLPSDNTFVFNQTVVNSFDPNDKICLQGATIPPSKVGDYVHYRIRFENNGTANAQNIVVKDMIDLSKLDISTLVPIKGSHSFVTNISSGNKVEFIFENINLPFDDANNDGYVAFKIKTKPTLVLGDTFSNTASIYFDYNFPIVTNTATTTIAALATKDFAFENYFSLYPNPVSNFLNITVNESIKISSINIYNTLGQLVLVIPNVQETKIVDVSSLSSGNYFIKIHSDKGTSNKKFVKI